MVTRINDGGIVFNDGTSMWTAARNGIGDGQSWQNVTGSRRTNTNYQNTTGKPIMVNVGATGGWGASFLVDQGWGWLVAASHSIPGNDFYGASQYQFSVIVPNGALYRLDGVVAGWYELR